VPASHFVFPYMIESIAGRRWSELLRGLGLSLLVALLTAGLTAQCAFHHRAFQLQRS
jgi:hypothetical protein